MMGCSIVRRLLVGIVTVGMVWLVCGCGGGGGSSGDNFELRMIDSSAGSRGLVGTRAGSQGVPEEAVSLWVYITEIRAIPTGGPPVRRTYEPAVEIDILDLSTAPSFTVWDDDLPPGDYVKLELILSGDPMARMTFPEGHDPAEVDVTVPSGPQTGLKFPIQFSIANGVHTTLVFDWNTGNSVHCTGNGEWKLRPTAMTVTEITTQETVDDVTIDYTDLAPDSAEPEQDNVGMLQLDFSVSDNFATIEAINVSLIGTGAATDVGAVRVWRDEGDPGFDPSQDLEIGSSVLSGTPASASIDIDPDETFTAGTTFTLLVSYDIAVGATVGNTVGVSITAIASPDTIVTALPINSGETEIITASPGP